MHSMHIHMYMHMDLYYVRVHRTAVYSYSNNRMVHERGYTIMIIHMSAASKHSESYTVTHGVHPNH